MRVRRRTFLARSAALAGAGALPFVFAERHARAAGYGPLVPDPDGLLDLPAGFRYALVERSGNTMSDGYRVPAKPDGMACFAGEPGTLVLLRNHEVNTAASEGAYGSGQQPPPEAYDTDRYGGVTRVVVDAVSFERISSNLVLTGTSTNCAGGPSPWGWLSCEEAFDSDHGYVFVCSVAASSVQAPVRIPGYGHFRHEAVAIETPSHRAYLTEDRPDGCLYRFVPDDPEAPFVGRLQALGIAGDPGFDTDDMQVGDELPVTWIDLEDPDPASDTLRDRAFDDGAAQFRRGEGIWYQDGVVYFDATSGGPAGLGQIFALRPTAEGGTLTLIAQSSGEDALNGPDNLTLAPWGDLVIAEDSLSGNGVHHLRGLTKEGEMYELARTTRSELAGVCFSPDGRALFVNVYGHGSTLVVTGPFPSIDSGGDGEGGQAGEAGQANAGSAGAPDVTSQGGEAGAPESGPGEAGAGGTPAPGDAGSGGNPSAGRTGSSGTGNAGMGAVAGNASATGGHGGGSGANPGTAGGTSAAGKPASLSPAGADSDCACRVGPRKRAGDGAALTALAGLAALLLRRTKGEEVD